MQISSQLCAVAALFLGIESLEFIWKKMDGPQSHSLGSVAKGKIPVPAGNWTQPIQPTVILLTELSWHIIAVYYEQKL